ncbi:hypothetical protein LTR36_007640 [Oleoguttula mirabilis]|uniref:Uncharacterized protein n=1 Tax=Oleoguttula mirabilis TaxID=1507867 RepID=A0AAV9JVR6_9PEZI|nr:hypothetical protein LTR36_007640 [Oleoguttula mirabilis]
MAKTKEKVAPQKSIKPSKAPKAPKAAVPKPAHLSQQYVADSDDEDAPPEDKGVKKVTTPAIPSKSQGKPKKKADKAQPAPQPPSESETETESSDEDDIAPPTADVARSPLPESTKINGVKRKAEEQSSSEEESVESEEEVSDEPAVKKVRTDGPVEKAAASEEEDSDESEEEESDESKEEAGAPQPALPPSRPKGRTAPTRPDTTEPIPAQPFETPAGYVPVDMERPATGTPYSTASLAGKQIWHIIAPSDVPLSSVTEVALDAIQSGRPLLTHNGVEYTLNEDAAGNEQEAVLLPGNDGYMATQQRVEKTLHLQQKITLPNLSTRQASLTTGSAAAGDIAQASVQTIRPQPKGLRMRYKPSGFGPGKPGMLGSGSDSADEAERPAGSASFQFPRALGAHSTSGHQTGEGGGRTPDDGASTKKPKKKRKEKQKEIVADSGNVGEGTREAHAGAEASHETGTSTSPSFTPIKKVVMPEVAEKPDVLMTDGVASEKNSKEEKARRKEEKRKMKAKQAAR